jgi:Right handed beta helix region
MAFRTAKAFNKKCLLLLLICGALLTACGGGEAGAAATQAIVAAPASAGSEAAASAAPYAIEGAEAELVDDSAADNSENKRVLSTPHADATSAALQASDTLAAAAAPVMVVAASTTVASSAPPPSSAAAPDALVAPAYVAAPSEAAAAAASSTGTTIEPPLVQAAFAVSRTIYVDPDAGKDANLGGTSSTPVRDLNSFVPLADVAIYLRKGTTTVLPKSLFVKNVFIGAYGTGAKPKLVMAPDQLAGLIAHNGSLHLDGVRLEGNLVTRTSGSAISSYSTEKLVVENCEILNFANGVVFGGSDSIIRNNVLSKLTNNGIVGGRRGVTAPSRSQVVGNIIDAAGTNNDAITLHDGTGFGMSNTISRNVITGPIGENGIDVLEQFGDTLIEGNTISGAAAYSISTSHTPSAMREATGTRIRLNKVSNSTRAAIYSRSRNAVIEQNDIRNIGSLRMASAVVVENSARILNNAIQVPAANTRPVITLVQTTESGLFGGEITGNVITDLSGMLVYGLLTPNRQLLLNAWTIESNTYKLLNINARAFAGMTFTDWRSGGNGTVITTKDRTSTLTSAR